MDQASLDPHTDALIAFVESRDLTFGGRLSPTQSDGIVACAGRRCVTEHDKEAMLGWLCMRREVASVEPGEFVAGWQE